MKKLFFSIILFFLITSCGGEIRDVSFSKDIVPIIKDNCLPCHGDKQQRGNLNFETYEKLMSSRYLNRSEPLVIKNEASQSRFYLVVHSQNSAIRMPPANLGYDRLDENEVKTIKIWINEGAKNN